MSDDKEPVKKKKKVVKKRAPKVLKEGSVDGRPKIEFTKSQWEQIDRCLEIHCTGEEIAGILNVSYDTLERNVKDTHGVTFPEYFAKKSAGGKMSLRRTQYTQAQNGNVPMLIWLGKNWLNQKDKTEISGDDDKPINLSYALPPKG